MISFLIPIYNFNVTNLVVEINQQAQKLDINYEIILVDDCSTSYLEVNEQLASYNNVRFIKLSKNYGRSKIRNYLAELAIYNNLVFLDCDSGIVNYNYVENYIQNIKHEIIYGGRIYQQKPPTKELYFHWFYGTNREVKSLEDRQKEPNIGFQTNNFLIKKDLFLKIKFNENLKGYGHEDTLFGYELKKRKIEISHIDNPVIHLGLETTQEFLSKTKNGIINLLKLSELYPKEKELFTDIKLLNYFFSIKKFYFCGLLKLIFKIFNKLIIRNIKSHKPKLKLFDLYKISYMCINNK